MASPSMRSRTKSATAGAGTALVEDARARQFRAARRHTFYVRALRLILPVFVVAIMAVYGLSAFRNATWVEGLASLPVPTITSENLTMDNPRYDGFTKDGGSYFVTARTARQDFDTPEVIVLNAISGEMVDPKKQKTVLSATGGSYHTEESILELAGDIKIDGDDGTKARLTRARIDTRQSIIMSDEPVDVSMRSGRITAKSMVIKQREKAADFIGDVKATVQPEAPDDTATPTARNADRSQLMLGDRSSPVTINAQKLAVRDADSRATFQGLVRAVQNDAILATEVLQIEYEPQDDIASGAPRAARPPSGALPGGAAANGQIKRIIAPQSVAMRRGRDQQVTADAAEFLAVEQQANLSGNVVVSSGATRSARSDQAMLDAKADTALLTGGVVVTQNDNVLRGQRLFIDRSRGLTQLTSPAADGGNGRISARLIPQSAAHGTESAKAKAKNTAGAVKNAAASPAGIADFATNPDAPVDIEAARLIVNDTTKTAVFRGNVRAQQGGFTIRTSQLIAHYKGDASLGDPMQPTEGVRNASRPAAELTAIEAKGKVLITSDGGQKATGDWAKFDIVRNAVTLGGDVVLSQGQNVVRGTRLNIDMTSGMSRIKTAPGSRPAGWASTLTNQNGRNSQVAPPGGVGARGGRPSAVFYPGQFQKQAKQKKDAAERKTSTNGTSSTGSDAPRKSSSSWEAFTAPN